MHSDAPRSWRGWLGQPLAGDSLRALRLVVGLVLAVALARFWARGWIDALLLAPTHRFSYLGFGWVAPLPRPAMHALFAALIALALGLAADRRPRICAALLGVGLAYVELIDKTIYLNHHVLLVLLCGLLALLPVGRRVPAWAVWAARAQLGLVYCFAGVAKLQADWLIDAQPMAIWLGGSTHLTERWPWLASRELALLASWAGCVFDLTIAGWLCWPRARPLALAAVVGFHLATAVLFPRLGLFPWIMIALSPIFLAPDWPRRLGLRWGEPADAPAQPVVARWRAALTAALLAPQLLIPLRHHLYPGDVLWSEEGFRFSWKVMLIEKAGVARFEVVEPASGRRWRVDLAEHFTPFQRKMLSTQPDMLVEAAQIIARVYAARGVRQPRVHADVWVSLNGGPTARLIDPEVDLAAARRSLAPAPWILPRPPRR